MTQKFVPDHLKQYIVNQDYSKYTYIDHAVWRYIMKINIDFFTSHGHESYIEGLEKTGISLEKIPRIEDMDEKLSKIGWGAVCVRGFIHPQAFMEFQSLAILPIAADMRTIEHLTYTPAPDIVHEAAGHAPILINEEYGNYIKEYGSIASKAIMSKEDLDLYDAIRELSDIKESPLSNAQDIENAEKELTKAAENISYISEMAILTRMNWWTVEYGLIGNLSDPKIYGAGLLSSVGESYNCLKEKVLKIPFDVDNIEYSYDITEQQPQLFVTPDFYTLKEVLRQVSRTMAYSNSGIESLNKVLQSKSVCTVGLNSRVQISGILTECLDKNNSPIFLRFEGPTQLSYENNEISGHGGDYHSHGYSTPIGRLENYNKPLSSFTSADMESLGLVEGAKIDFLFESGIQVNGILSLYTCHEDKLLLMSIDKCIVKFNDNILFQPDWGMFDMVCGEEVGSASGGAADKVNFHKFVDKQIKKDIPVQDSFSDKELKLNNYYKQVRDIRESGNENISELENIYHILNKDYSDEWLLLYEILEIINGNLSLDWAQDILETLREKAKQESDLGLVITRSLNLL